MCGNWPLMSHGAMNEIEEALVEVLKEHSRQVGID